MDRTKEYILMCEKAVEVQELWEPKEGDVYCHTDGLELTSVYLLKYIHTLKNYLSKTWWLLRQGQLQGMVKTNSYTGTLCLFNLFIKNKYDEGSTLANPQFHFKSMEQLWLAFVMKEEYNKIWNGKDWEIKNESYS